MSRSGLSSPDQFLAVFCCSKHSFSFVHNYGRWTFSFSCMKRKFSLSFSLTKRSPMIPVSDLDTWTGCRLSVRWSRLGSLCRRGGVADCRTVWNVMSHQPHTIDYRTSSLTSDSIHRPLIHTTNQLYTDICHATSHNHIQRNNSTVTQVTPRSEVQALAFVCRYVAPPGECYYDTLICCDYFSSSSAV